MNITEEEIKKNLRSIGGVANYYGGLAIICHQGKYYWTITSTLSDDQEFEEISKKLYDELIRFESKREKWEMEQEHRYPKPVLNGTE